MVSSWFFFQNGRTKGRLHGANDKLWQFDDTKKKIKVVDLIMLSLHFNENKEWRKVLERLKPADFHFSRQRETCVGKRAIVILFYLWPSNKESLSRSRPVHDESVSSWLIFQKSIYMNLHTGGSYFDTLKKSVCKFN